MSQSKAPRGPHGPSGPTTAPGGSKAASDAPLPPDRAILEDRYDGLLGWPGQEWSTKTWQRLQRVLQDLYEGTARREWTGDLADDGAVLDELQAIIRAHLIARIDELGVACSAAAREQHRTSVR